jgi:hypothetical protein
MDKKYRIISDQSEPESAGSSVFFAPQMSPQGSSCCRQGWAVGEAAALEGNGGGGGGWGEGEAKNQQAGTDSEETRK